MGNSRKDFLKKTGLAGLSLTGAGLIGCTSQSGNGSRASKTSLTDWRADPEWRKVKYGDWSGSDVPSGPGPMDEVLLKDYAPRPTVVSGETFVSKARYPVIDVHIHNYPEREKADYPSAWKPPTVFQERTPIFQQFNQHGGEGLSYDELIPLEDDLPDFSYRREEWDDLVSWRRTASARFEERLAIPDIGGMPQVTVKDR